MYLISIILILISIRSNSDFFVGISDIVKTLHQSCLKFTPITDFAPYYSAIVCGEDAAKEFFLVDGFKKLGIYHLLIISGSHLTFLSLMLERFLKIKRNSFVSILALGVFCLVTGFQPPALRSFLVVLISVIQKKLKLFWSPQEIVFLSFCFCIALNPSWKTSGSLMISYAAGVIMLLTTGMPIFKRALCFYLMLFVFLLPLAPPNIFSILTVPILSLLVELTLFPLCFASFVFHFLVPVTDFFWRWVLFLVAELVPYFPQYEALLIPQNFLWILVVGMNFFGILKEKKHYGISDRITD